jgi:CBS domain-containing protein
MAAILEILKQNQHDLHVVQHDQTVIEAVHFMVENNVGAVPVLDGGDLVGIFSERDLMTKVLVRGHDPHTTVVETVMTEGPLSVAPDASIHDCMVLMKQHKFRHLPICDGHKLVGFLSLRDLLLHEVDEKDIEVRMMRAYIAS